LAAAYPDLVNVVTIATSHQNRPIRAVRVTSGGTTKNAAIFFHGGIHAREWISPATVLYMLNEIVTTYNSDPVIKRAVDTFEIYVCPVFNVDGYVHTWTSDRMWRKTRNPNAGSTCIGTDPNRNFGAGWGGPGASTNPCSETYRGTGAFSSVEVRSVTNFLTNLDNGNAAGDKLKGYIDFHSYSQIWLSPFGYTNVLPPDFSEQDRVNREAIAAIASLYGTRYTFGPIYTAIYPASGGSIDWAYQNLGVVHAYSPELRDTGNYGFLLPPAQIIPSGDETFLGLKVWINACLNG